jgi:hypothetical protein
MAAAVIRLFVQATVEDDDEVVVDELVVVLDVLVTVEDVAGEDPPLEQAPSSTVAITALPRNPTTVVL